MAASRARENMHQHNKEIRSKLPAQIGDRSLFDYFDVTLPPLRRSSEKLPPADSYAPAAPYLYLVSGSLSIAAAPDGQTSFSFDFPDTGGARVFYFAPKASHPCLDHGVYDALRDNDALAKIALKLEGRGIRLLGDLVQLEERDLLGFKFVDEQFLDELRTELATARLRLGMTIPFWSRRTSANAR